MSRDGTSRIGAGRHTQNHATPIRRFRRSRSSVSLSCLARARWITRHSGPGAPERRGYAGERTFSRRAGSVLFVPRSDLALLVLRKRDPLRVDARQGGNLFLRSDSRESGTEAADAPALFQRGRNAHLPGRLYGGRPCGNRSCRRKRQTIIRTHIDEDCGRLTNCLTHVKDLPAARSVWSGDCTGASHETPTRGCWNY